MQPHSYTTLVGKRINHAECFSCSFLFIFYHMALSKVLIRSDWIFWTMRMLSLCTCFMQGPLSVCLSLFSPQHQHLTLKMIVRHSWIRILFLPVVCGFLANIFDHRDHITKHPKEDNYEVTSFKQSLTIYCGLWEQNLIDHRIQSQKNIILFVLGNRNILELILYINIY